MPGLHPTDEETGLDGLKVTAYSCLLSPSSFAVRVTQIQGHYCYGVSVRGPPPPPLKCNSLSKVLTGVPGIEQVLSKCY